MRFGSVVEWAANSIPITAVANIAATVKGYVLNEFAAPTGPVSMNNQRLTGLPAPADSADAARKSYVDTAMASAQSSAVASAKTYTDTQDAATLAAAKTYTDNKVVPANVPKIVRGTFGGDGSTKDFTITHNLGAYTYTFSMIDGANNHYILTDCVPLDGNSSIVSFGVAPSVGENFYYVLVG